jgi:hypothetical protein
MSTSAPASFDSAAFFNSLQDRLQSCRHELHALGPETIARATGFLKRSPRKIPIPDFLNGLLAVAPETHLTLEHTAQVIGLAAHTTYTKQALSERLDPDLQAFLVGVITAWLGQLTHHLPVSQALDSFARVLVQDSTSQSLPDHLAKAFRGAGNQHGQDYATLKIQWITDLKNSAVEHVSLSGFTRNDQAAAPDILQVTRPGDLVLRDLGYFTTPVLAQLVNAQIAFLSRYRHDVHLYDPQTGNALDLITLLKRSCYLDCQVLLGPERVPVRLVALPVPQEVANERRHKAKTYAARHPHRSPPGAQHLFLMGWNLFVTSVPKATWSPKTVAAVYRLRWRIEIIFKAWKSHLGLRQLNCRTPELLELSVLTKLLFCAIVCQASDQLELLCAPNQHVSILRLGRILAQCACWFSAGVLGISVAAWVRFCLTHHAFYDRRQDRSNYYELLTATPTALA